MELNKIYNMDCLEGMKLLEDKSVNLCIADPPYYRIKKDEWDNQWQSFEEYLAWIEEVSVEIKRVLKDNGSFYIFADDQRVAYIQVKLDKHFTFLNHLVWFKTNNLPLKFAHNHRKYAPMSERILFYSVQRSKTGLEETMNLCVKDIREYIRSEIIKSKGKLNFKEINHAMGGATSGGGLASGILSLKKDMPIMITKERYETLRTWLGKMFLNVGYEDLRRQYEDLRRPYNHIKGVHEIISEPIITLKENTDHSTTKPVRLLEKFVKCSSNEGDLILDPFMGSGSTAIACLKLSRDFIGFETSKKYVEMANKRIKPYLEQNKLGKFF